MVTYTDIAKPSTPVYISMDEISDFLLSTNGGYLLLTSGGRIELRRANPYTSLSKPSAPSYTSLSKPSAPSYTSLSKPSIPTYSSINKPT